MCYISGHTAIKPADAQNQKNRTYKLTMKYINISANPDTPAVRNMQLTEYNGLLKGIPNKSITIIEIHEEKKVYLSSATIEP